ncbi:MAG: Lrp/AsnC family transcriptional regulator [Sphingobium sp.]|uniref:Lrp/AsnC family transcriptional regulator n=1 Tax=Sphingobium sp. TaxID=1912891 RepID=UPI0029A33489|nr:Lrp/AsnC family transcriptional regulator [Sphingobium sp.]MDX3909754.1 Lrp/AsnC family transcriptional regulator [Sphingobium sp.]
MPAELDAMDRKILTLMQKDASLTVAQIAESVGLSQSPCWRRIQRMRKEGIILGQVTLLDRQSVGLNAQIFAQVRLNGKGRENIEEFSRAIQGFDEVLDCYVTLGATDFILRIVASDINAYERFFFDKLSRVPGIQEINSMVALSEIKSTTALPL